MKNCCVRNIFELFKGRLFYKSGDKYDGEFKNNLRNGFGKK